MTDRLLTFCQFLSELNLSNTPSPVVAHAKKMLIDTLGVIVAGSTSREVSQLALAMGGVTGRASATCCGRSEDYHPLHAALLNGMAGSTLEYEEGHSRAMGHPAIQIIPALLAVAESEDLSGAQLLKGLIGGYEAACRISLASQLRQGIHPTGSWGVIGSALGVGLLKGRSPEALAQIAELAACSLAVPWVENSFGGWSASCMFAGAANQAGVAANLQFDAGLRAASGSMAKTFSSFVSDRFDWDKLAVRPDDSLTILDNYFKPYPTCRYTHPALDAAQQIMAKHTVDIGRITEIRVYSFSAATHMPLQPTRNTEAVRFSIPHLIGILLSRDRVDLETLTGEVLGDPLVASLAGKVRLILEPTFEAARPKENPARVEIIFSNGKCLDHEVRDGRGGPCNPIADEEIAEKFLTLCGPVVGNDQAGQCLTSLNQFDKEPEVRTALRLLRP